MLRPLPLAMSAAALLAAAAPAAAAFMPGNLVVAVSGNGVRGAAGGSYGGNQASPLTLFQYAPAGTTGVSFVDALVLPQQASGANAPVSAEYGSSSEGMLHLSGDGRLLTIAGYGVSAAAFNADPAAYGQVTTDPAKRDALAQSGSVAGQGYVPVPRVIALIDANGNVDSSTALTGVFNGNNPRAAYTLDGRAIYVSGQGTGSDGTAGVFYTTRGATSATAVTGNDTSKKTLSQDTRDVQVVDGQLVVSADSKGGNGSNRDYVGTLGTAGALPTGLANGGNGPAMLPGFGNSGGTGKLVITAATGNGLNSAGQEINLSPNGFFFASPDVLYVADGGNPKNDSVANDANGSRLGDGGLQKWILRNGQWSIAYTLADGLDLVANPNASANVSGTTGLFGLAGQVAGDAVSLFATTATIGDLDQTYLYGITDVLSATTRPAGRFTRLDAAPADSSFRGVSFAPAAALPEPGTWATMLAGFGALGLALRRQRPAHAA